jgi:UMF1 family MFS transporter
MASLWWAKPGTAAPMLWLIVLAFIIATMAAEFTTVFTNSIMPTLVPQSQIGRLSGIGWGVGYAGGLVSLALMAGLVVTNPATGKTLLGLNPVLQLDTALREGDRLVGPFSAAWYLIFMIPFFLFVPDVRRSAATQAAHRSPVAELLSTLRELTHHRDMLLFLIARAIYIDGLSAIFAFGGIYGSSVFGWQAFELGLFGIILTLTGAFGAVIGGFLDDRWGSKRVIVVALLILMVGAAGILSVTKGAVLFELEVPPKTPGSRPFSSTGELVYLAFAMLIGIVAAPVQAASRSLLAHLAPPEKMTQFFGLFAFSGKVTAFAAPFLIAAVTTATGSQRAGMTVIAGFLVTGMLLMLPVRTKRSMQPG